MLELKNNFENKVESAIWHYLKQLVFLQRKYILKTTSLKHAFWRYLKWFGFAETILKTMGLDEIRREVDNVQTMYRPLFNVPLCD